MYDCNECDRSFSKKYNLLRHHERHHGDEASLSSLLHSLNGQRASDEPATKRAKSHDDTEEGSDGSGSERDESIESASSTDNDSDDDIEEKLNSEDEATPSLEPLVSVWKIIGTAAEQEYDGNELEAYIDQVRMGRQLKNDPVHVKVLETMESLQERDLNMDFEEALVKAVNRRKHLITQAVESNASGDDEEKKA